MVDIIQEILSSQSLSLMGDLLFVGDIPNLLGFALFCIFVRNGISVMVTVTDYAVDISDITGLLTLLKPDIISITVFDLKTY